MKGEIESKGGRNFRDVERMRESVMSWLGRISGGVEDAGWVENEVAAAEATEAPRERDAADAEGRESRKARLHKIYEYIRVAEDDRDSRRRSRRSARRGDGERSLG